MNLKTPFYFFSSSELVFNYITLTYTVYYLNLYTFSLICLLSFKTILFKFIKKLFIKYKFGKRPDKAFNCNVFNCGGKSNSGGMPSAHMGFMGIIATVIFTIYKVRKNKDIVYIYIILSLLTAISRYGLHCHTIPQIIIGYLLGVTLSIGYYYIDEYLDKNSKPYSEARSKFLSHFK